MKLLLLVTAILFITNCNAQSPFKRLPKPESTLGAFQSNAIAPGAAISAFRFTGPIAGFMYPQNQLVTGIGYGYNKLHWVDSTQRYYTDFSINAVAYAGGNVTPSIHPNNIISLGVSVGALNQLIMVGPAYNLPSGGSSKGSVGFVVNISVPLN
jgi:hypothetical protein